MGDDVVKDGDTVANELGAKQSFVAARVDLIPPECLMLIAECFGFGGRKYGEYNWLNIPLRDHLNHAHVHMLKWQMGDRNEPHLVNAAVRTIMALYKAIQQDEQPAQYIHPDMIDRVHNALHNGDDKGQTTEVLKQQHRKPGDPCSTSFYVPAEDSPITPGRTDRT